MENRIEAITLRKINTVYFCNISIVNIHVMGTPSISQTMCYLFISLDINYTICNLFSLLIYI